MVRRLPKVTSSCRSRSKKAYPLGHDTNLFVYHDTGGYCVVIVELKS